MTLYLGDELIANSVTVPYNWSGTKAEYEALATINPEWVYYITDTQEILKGTQLISNVGLNKQQITNCILEDPQNIKLELNNGTLTLKAGSVVCVPNGFESDGTTPKFDEVVIASDLTLSGRANNDIICYDADNNTLYMSVTGTSGSSVPTTSTWFYNTNTNLLKRYSSGSSNTGKCSFPICMVSNNGTTYSSIDQTFQSIGYIGSTVFVRKGLKVLIPDGRNADGSLKNIEKEILTTNVFTNENTVNADIFITIDNNGQIGRFTKSVWNYYPTSNLWINYLGTVEYKCAVGVAKATNGVLSGVDIFGATNILKYSDKTQISGWGMPSASKVGVSMGASGATYTAPCNGYFYVGGTCTNPTAFVRIYNNTLGIGNVCWSYASSGNVNETFVPVNKNDVCTVTYYQFTPTAAYYNKLNGEI